MFSGRMNLAAYVSLSVVMLAKIITILKILGYRRRGQYTNKIELVDSANKNTEHI